MQILLDDIPCNVEARTVGEAIEGGADLARDRGRLIVDVTVDGSQLSEADLASPAQQTRTAQVVRLVTADPVELVRQTLDDAREALAEADELQIGVYLWCPAGAVPDIAQAVAGVELSAGDDAGKNVGVERGRGRDGAAHEQIAL